mgnify:CR=1 FL=1|tara:strand:- start:2425 stop:2712 length:288 start_codon:yes stop_codon:yes gene_type:complete
MRIDEITINIPITIDLGDIEPKVKVAGKDADGDELDQNPVMISPLQQELELKKAAQGKTSPVIDKILDAEDTGNEYDTNQTDSIKTLRALAGLNK